MRVSYSKVATWRRCRQQFYYKYIEGLKRKTVARPLRFGSLVHQMIEAHGNGDDPFSVLDNLDLKQLKLFEAEREMYGDIVHDIRLIMTDYFKYWPEDSLVYSRINGKSTEHELEIEISSNVIWVMKIDGIARSPNKLRWLVEHKTKGVIPNDDERWRNIQSAVYIRAIDMAGWPSVDGTCWDYILSKPPTAPAILKSGKVSKAKLVTLPSKVEEFIRENKLRGPDATDLRKNAINCQPRWFERVFNAKRKKTIDRLYEDFVSSCIEIVRLRNRPPVRNIERHCSWCDYEPICRAALTGGDVDYIKEKEYFHRDADQDLVKESSTPD